MLAGPPRRVFNSSGKRVILHHFLQLRPSQTRGIPILMPIVETLEQISELTQSELMAAVVTSFLTVISSTKSGESNFITNPDQSAGNDNNENLILGYGSIL